LAEIQVTMAVNNAAYISASQVATAGDHESRRRDVNWITSHRAAVRRYANTGLSGSA